MTPTEKRYLLFLSARTPRPKSADRPGKAVLQRMTNAGWIAQSPRASRFSDPWQSYITDMGERALDALEAPRVYVVWHPIASMPEDKTLLVTDGELVRAGVLSGGNIHAGIATPQSHWTHWAALPSPPPSKDAAP